MIMPQELPAQKTLVTAAQMFDALHSAWVGFLRGEPKKESLCLLVAHWAFETGLGHGMWNFNIGNVKSREGDGRDYTFFACTENMDVNTANVLVEKLGSQAQVQYVRGTVATVKFFPKHPACRFRAFASLDLAATDYIELLTERFSDENQEKDAWHWVVQGDPAAFSHALKLKGYYTGDEATYTRQVVSIFHSLMVQQPFTASAPADQPQMDGQGLVALQTGFSQSLADQDGEPEPEGNV
jgi:hypothetical protein